MADGMQLGPVQGLVSTLWSRESELLPCPAVPLQKSSHNNKASGHLGLSLPCKLGKAYSLSFSLKTVLWFARALFFFFFFDGHPLHLF